MRVAWAVVAALMKSGNCGVGGAMAWGLSGWDARAMGVGTVSAARDSAGAPTDGPLSSRPPAADNPPTSMAVVATPVPRTSLLTATPTDPPSAVSPPPPTLVPLTNPPRPPPETSRPSPGPGPTAGELTLPPTPSTSAKSPTTPTTTPSRLPVSSQETADPSPASTPFGAPGSADSTPEPSKSAQPSPSTVSSWPTTTRPATSTLTPTDSTTPTTTTKKPEVSTPITTTKKPEVMTPVTTTKKPEVTSPTTTTKKPEVTTPVTTKKRADVLTRAPSSSPLASVSVALVSLTTLPLTPIPVDAHTGADSDDTISPRTTPPRSTPLQSTTRPPTSPSSSPPSTSPPTKPPASTLPRPQPTLRPSVSTATPQTNLTSQPSTPNSTAVTKAPITDKPSTFTTPKPATPSAGPIVSTTAPVSTTTTAAPQQTTTRPLPILVPASTTNSGLSPSTTSSPSLSPSPIHSVGQASMPPVITSLNATGPLATPPLTTARPVTKQPIFSDPTRHSNRSGTASPTPTPSETPSLLALLIISDLEHPKTDVGQHVLPQGAQSVATGALATPEGTPHKTEPSRLIDTPSGLAIQNGSSVEAAQDYKRTSSPVGPRSTEPHGSASGFDDVTVVLGGRNRTRVVPGADVGVSLMGQTVQATIQVASSGVSVAAVVLLVILHVVALYSPPWLPSGRGRAGGLVASWLTPRACELPVIFTFLQHLSSISMMELTKAPYFLLDFTDSFSWTNFNLHSSGSSPSRHLEFTILTGVVAYADRLGMEESKLLAYTTRVFFAAVGILFGCFFAAVLLRRYCTKSSAQSSGSTCGFAMCFLGLATALWVVSAFPLCAISSFELRMELQFSFNGDIAIVLFNLIIVLFGGLALFVRRVQNIRPEHALDYRYVAVLGTLYADNKSGTRFFFALSVLFHMGTGAVVGTIIGGQRQLIALLVFHSVFIFALIIVRPFRSSVVNWIVGTLTVLRFINVMLCTAFVTASTMSTAERGQYANTLVFANFVVVLLIFFRQFLVLIYVLRMWSSRRVPINAASPDTHTGHTIELDASLHTGDDKETVVEAAHHHTSFSTEWNPAASSAESESPVPNLANRPAKAPRKPRFRTSS